MGSVEPKEPNPKKPLRYRRIPIQKEKKEKVKIHCMCVLRRQDSNPDLPKSITCDISSWVIANIPPLVDTIK